MKKYIHVNDRLNEFANVLRSADDAVLLSARLSNLTKHYRLGLITESEALKQLFEIETDFKNKKQ